MKTKLFGITVFLITLATTYSVNAATYTDTHTANIEISGPNNPWSLTTYTWTFDLTKNGFNPAEETISDAIIQLNLNDDNDALALEFANIQIGDQTSSAWTVVSELKTLTVTSFTTLNATGLLNITLMATQGDFSFLVGELIANTTAINNPSAVPAPSALLLMGSGLIGVATAARRKAKNKA